MQYFLKKNSLLIILILLVAVKGIIWTIAIPLFHGNDEHAHYATVQTHNIPRDFIAEKNEKKPEFENIETHNISPELKDFLTRSSVDEARFFSENKAEFDDHSEFGLNEKNFLNSQEKRLKNHVTALPAWKVDQPPLYYKLGSVLEKSFNQQPLKFRALAIRFMSSFFGLLTVILAFFSFRLLGFKKNQSFLFSLLIAFQPMFCYITSIISVDSLLIFDFSLFIFASLLIFKKGFSKKRASLLLLAFLLAIATKTTAWVLVVFFIFLIILLIKKHRKKKALGYVGFSILSCAILSYYIIPARIKGSLPKLSYLEPDKIHSFLLQHFSFYPLVHNSKLYWGFFGNFDAPIHRYVLYAIWFVLLIAFFGIIKFFISRKDRKQRDLKLMIIFSAFVIFALHFAILAVDFNFFARIGEVVIGAPGRYFLPVIIAKMFLIAFGIINLFPKKYWNKILVILAFLMILLNHYCLFKIIIPRFYL